MRLDHIAYRVRDRYKTASFFVGSLGYKIGTEFKIKFSDESTADCVILTPSETRHPDTSAWIRNVIIPAPYAHLECEFHAPPEIFVSDGSIGSIVGDWVSHRDGVGGIHHLAYQVDNVGQKMQEWKDKGFAEFLSETPLTCPGLTQVFTKPSELTGVIYELITRTGRGFCEDNVKNLMESTRTT